MAGLPESCKENIERHSPARNRTYKLEFFLKQGGYDRCSEFKEAFTEAAGGVDIRGSANVYATIEAPPWKRLLFQAFGRCLTVVKSLCVEHGCTWEADWHPSYSIFVSKGGRTLEMASCPQGFPTVNPMASKEFFNMEPERLQQRCQRGK